MKLFLDDERFPVSDDFIIVRNFLQFTDAVMKYGKEIEFISFDHDLGYGEKTGKDCANWLVEYDQQRDIITDQFHFDVHSMNPVGAHNIRALLLNYLDFKFGG